MRTLLARLLAEPILRAPDGEGGSGGGDGGAAAAAAADPAAAAADPAATAADPAAGAAAPYRPEGLAESYHGETDQQTIDKLFAAMSARGEVPDDIAAYQDVGDVDDELKPYYETIKQDGLFDQIAMKAKDLGISTAQMHGLLGAYMNGAKEMGLLEPVVDVAAERTALLPDNAKSMPKAAQDQAIDRRMADNIGWVEQMVQRGLPADSARHMTLMLGDTADGHKAIEFFRSQMTGAAEPKPAGAGGAAAADTSRKDLERRSALPENTPNHIRFDRSSYDQLQRDYQAAYPD